jgi:hypothetical protein
MIEVHPFELPPDENYNPLVEFRASKDGLQYAAAIAKFNLDTLDIVTRYSKTDDITKDLIKRAAYNYADRRGFKTAENGTVNIKNFFEQKCEGSKKQ